MDRGLDSRIRCKSVHAAPMRNWWSLHRHWQRTIYCLLLVSLAVGCRSSQKNCAPNLFASSSKAIRSELAPTDDKKAALPEQGSGSTQSAQAIKQVGYLQDEDASIPDAEPVATDVDGNALLDDEDVLVDEDEGDDSVKDDSDDEDLQDPLTEYLNSDSTIETVAQSGKVGSLQAMIDLAIAINPGIARAQAQLASLRGKCIQAGLLPNPTTGIFGGDINEGGSPGRYGVLYGNRIVRGDKLRLARQQVHAEIKAQRVLVEELRQRVVTDVRLRYYDLLVAIEKSNVASQLVELSRNGTEATEQLVEAKELARTSLLQAELELQQAHAIERRAHNDIANARRSLAGMIGESDLPFEDFTGSLDEFAGPIDIESAFDRLVEESPEIAKLHASVEVERRNLAKQRAQQVSDLTWQTGLAYDFATDDVVANFQLSWPIQKYNRNQGAISSARHSIVASEKKVEQKALQLRQQLVAAYRNYWDAKLQVDSIRSQILPKAKETLDLIVLGYREGEVSFLELLTAQRTYFQFNLENINQQQNLWKHRVAIEGLLLSKNFDVE